MPFKQRALIEQILLDSNRPNPIDSVDQENEGTGSSGLLTIDYVSNIVFGKQNIGSRTVIYNAINENPFV